MENSRFQRNKEWFIVLLAVASVGLVIIEDRVPPDSVEMTVLTWLDTCIWLIFVADYAIGMWKSDERWKYFKGHLIELIAILPFSALLKGLRAVRLFRFTRLARTMRLVRLAAYAIRLTRVLRRFFAAHNFYLAVIITALFILFGSVAISHFEEMSLGDALWWAFVTATTVGYGDISPTTTEGRFMAAFLMIIGVGFLGFLTGAVSSFFLSPDTDDTSKPLNPHIQLIMKQLRNFDSLSKSEVLEITQILTALKQDAPP